MAAENQDSIKGKKNLTVRVSDDFYDFMSTLCADTGADMSQHMRAALLMYANWISGERGIYDGLYDYD